MRQAIPEVARFALLRHARAGKKLPERRADFNRSLDPVGIAVSVRLPSIMSSHLDIREIRSSPYRRCLQTVDPLATSFALHVHDDDHWAPDTSRAKVQRALAEIRPGTVICTHGEVIGQQFELKCAKGAFWVVERRGGSFIPIRYVDARVPEPSARSL